MLGLAVVVSYNRFIKQRNLVQESWRQVDVELTRRHDLVPNLVETVKGYASHERQTLEAVTAARAAAAAPGAGPAQQAVQENVLQSALRQLFAVAEAYPDLKASSELPGPAAAAGRDRGPHRREPALLQRQRAGAQHARRVLPVVVVAKTFDITRAEYFTAEDPEVRANPTVSFS